MPQTDRTPQLRARSREWVPVTYTQDEILARMLLTYLEAAKLEARMQREADSLCIEVPEDQFERACEICDPADTPDPAMQEAANTGLHAIRRTQEPPVTQKVSDRNSRGQLILKLVVAGTILVFLIWLIVILT